jgi:hypothetical protein
VRSRGGPSDREARCARHRRRSTADRATATAALGRCVTGQSESECLDVEASHDRSGRPARATAARRRTPPSTGGCRRAASGRGCGHLLSRRDATAARLNDRPPSRGNQACHRSHLRLAHRTRRGGQRGRGTFTLAPPKRESRGAAASLTVRARGLEPACGLVARPRSGGGPGLRWCQVRDAQRGR